MKLTDLNNPRYISLETFRKNGEGVRTPVWTVEKAGKLYVWTDAESWKVKRMRNNPKVRVAPSDMRGTVKGTWVDGIVQIIEDDAQDKTMRQSIASKYKLEYWIFSLMAAISRLFGKGMGARAVVEIRDQTELSQ